MAKLFFIVTNLVFKVYGIIQMILTIKSNLSIYLNVILAYLLCLNYLYTLKS